MNLDAVFTILRGANDGFKRVPITKLFLGDIIGVNIYCIFGGTMHQFGELFVGWVGRIVKPIK